MASFKAVFFTRCFVCSAATSQCCPSCHVHYCSADCQTQHWIEHQPICAQLQIAGKSKRDKSPKRTRKARKREEAEEEEEEENIDVKLHELNRELAPLQAIFHAVDPDDVAPVLTSETLQQRIAMHRELIRVLKQQRALGNQLTAEQELQLRESAEQLAVLNAAAIVSRQYVGKLVRTVESSLKFVESYVVPNAMAFLVWGRRVIPDWFRDIWTHVQRWRAAGSGLEDLRSLSYKNLGPVFKKLGHSAYNAGTKSLVYLYLLSKTKLAPALAAAFKRIYRVMLAARLSKDEQKRIGIVQLELELLQEAVGDDQFDQQAVARAITRKTKELSDAGIPVSSDGDIGPRLLSSLRRDVQAETLSTIAEQYNAFLKHLWITGEWNDSFQDNFHRAVRKLVSDRDVPVRKYLVSLVMFLVKEAANFHSIAESTKPPAQPNIRFGNFPIEDNFVIDWAKFKQLSARTHAAIRKTFERYIDTLQHLARAYAKSTDQGAPDTDMNVKFILRYLQTNSAVFSRGLNGKDITSKLSLIVNAEVALTD